MDNNILVDELLMTEKERLLKALQSEERMETKTWQDTVMTINDILEHSRNTEGLCPIVDTMGVKICQAIAERQAGISFKAGYWEGRELGIRDGRREVVEWIGEQGYYSSLMPAECLSNNKEWQAFLKSKGIGE